jgi:serine/threonine-protein kinase
MMTGRLPFPGEDEVELLRAHIHDPPPSPREVAPEAGIPVPVEQVILRALRKGPGQRWPSAESMIKAIDIATGRRPARSLAPLWWTAALVAAAVAAAAWWWLRRRP